MTSTSSKSSSTTNGPRSSIRSYPQPPRMLFGDSPTKRLAKNFVRGIVAAGSTRHLDALKLALGMRPDVIFFLTDAGEPQSRPAKWRTSGNETCASGAQINVIEFGAGPNPGGRNFLVRLAEENSGQYVYVDVTRLPSAERVWSNEDSHAATTVPVPAWSSSRPRGCCVASRGDGPGWWPPRRAGPKMPW